MSHEERLAAVTGRKTPEGARINDILQDILFGKTASNKLASSLKELEQDDIRRLSEVCDSIFGKDCKNEDKTAEGLYNVKNYGHNGRLYEDPAAAAKKEAKK